MIFDGDVYLAQAETGHYKIGISRNPDRRIKHFDTIMPVRVFLIHNFPCDNCRKAEEELHQRYANQRTAGEWFLLDDYDIEQLLGITAYFEGHFHWEMNEGDRAIFELERTGQICWVERELPY